MPITRPQAEQEFNRWFTNRSFTDQDLANAQKYGLGIYEASANEIRNKKRGSSLLSADGGPDMTGWSQSMIDSYKAMTDYVNKLIAQGKTVNPNITIDEATVAKFTEQAKTELGPYYKSMFSQAKSDLDRVMGRIRDDAAQNEQTIGEQYGQALEDTQNNMASRGLAFSSERDKAEKLLADRTTRALQQNLTNAQRSAEDTGFSALRMFGSKNLPSSFDIGSGARPIVGQPGAYSLTGGNTTRATLFSAPSDVIGSQERQQMFDEKSRVNELTANERMLRGYYTM